MEAKKLFIGIDVSKGYSDFIILTWERRVFEQNFQLDDTKEGHQILQAKLTSLISKGYRLICGVENTGGYERNWVAAIKALSKKNTGVEIYKLNPRAVKHQIQSLLRRTVNDAVSAQGIALYMINNYDMFQKNWKNSTDKDEKTNEAQLLHGMIMSLMKQAAMKKNQLEKVLYLSFPEFLAYVKNPMPNWVLKLIEKYPSAAAVSRATLKGLTSIKGISEEKAKDIKEKAKNSVASGQGKISDIIVSQHSKDITLIEKEIGKLKKVLIKEYEDNPNVKLLTSVKGIGEWTATAFLIELGDWTRFETTDQLAAFYGVNPSFKQSGDGKYKSKMSKQGSATMRAILYQIAHNLVLHNEYFQALYAKHKAKGKKNYVVMGILMHKVLRMLWGMLKSNTGFNPKIDIKNQEKYHQKESTNPISIKSRRLQPLTLQAPISRSNSKKRKAMLEPQSSTADEHTRSSKHSSVQM
jgi:transposase